MGGTERASGDVSWITCTPHLTRACRPGIQPLFRQPLLLLAVVVVREVEAWSPLAGPVVVAVVLKEEGGLEEGADVVL